MAANRVTAAIFVGAALVLLLWFLSGNCTDQNSPNAPDNLYVVFFFFFNFLLIIMVLITIFYSLASFCFFFFINKIKYLSVICYSFSDNDGVSSNSLYLSLFTVDHYNYKKKIKLFSSFS